MKTIGLSDPPSWTGAGRKAPDPSLGREGGRERSPSPPFATPGRAGQCRQRTRTGLENVALYV